MFVWAACQARIWKSSKGRISMQFHSFLLAFHHTHTHTVGLIQKGLFKRLIQLKPIEVHTHTDDFDFFRSKPICSDLCGVWERFEFCTHTHNRNIHAWVNATVCRTKFDWMLQLIDFHIRKICVCVIGNYTQIAKLGLYNWICIDVCIFRYTSVKLFLYTRVIFSINQLIAIFTQLIHLCTTISFLFQIDWKMITSFFFFFFFSGNHHWQHDWKQR